MVVLFPMFKKIYSNAKDFNKKALNYYIEKDFNHAIVNLAISAELLGKAFLSKIHPSLIVNNDFDSLLHVCEAGKHSRKSPSNIRTIGAKEVYKRCFQILPELRNYEENLNLLADVKNGLVHLADFEKEIINKVFLPYLKYIKKILEAIETPLDDFFGEFTKLANISIQKSAKEIDIKVQCLLAKSKSDYKNKFKNTEKKVRKSIIDTIVKSYVLEQYNEELIDCPSCNNLSAIISGSHEVVDWEVDFDRDGTPIGGYPVVVLYGASLKCEVCGLKLNSPEEINAVGIESSLTLEDIDPSDFYEEIDYNDIL